MSLRAHKIMLVDKTGRRDRDRIFKDVTNVCGDLSWVGWDVSEQSISVTITLRLNYFT